MYKNILAVLAFCFSLSSQASFIYYGEDLNPGASTANSDAANTAFLNALTGVGTENFETFSVGSNSPLSIDFGLAGTATLTGTGEILSGDYFGRFATSGTKYWNTNESFVIEFSQAISAFGFYGTDIGDIGGQITMEFQSGATTTLRNVGNTTGAPDGSLLYWGIIDEANPFTRITFGNTNNSDVFGFDDMTIGLRSQVVGNTIPEPSILAIFGLALMGLRLRKTK